MSTPSDRAVSAAGDDDRVRAMIDNLASSYEEPEQVVKYYYGNEQQLAQIKNLVLEEQVVDRVLDAAQVKDVSMSYDEAIKPAPPPEPDTAEGEATPEGKEE